MVRSLIQDRNNWLWLAFLSYLFFVILFSILYYLFYKRNRENYCFGSDILKTQKNMFGKKAESILKIIYVQIPIFLDLISRLKNKDDILVIDGSDTIASLPDGHKITITKHVTVVPDYAETSLTLTINDPSGNPIREGYVSGSHNNTNPKSKKDFIEILENETKNLEKQRLYYLSRLNTFEDEQPDVWSYLDFVYFSCITQTTVGYGDILPNSTLIRMFVVLQIFLGYLILVVIINLVVVKG